MSTTTSPEFDIDACNKLVRTAANRIRVWDHEETLSLARYYYVLARTDHDPARGPLDKRLSYMIHTRLTDRRKAEIRHRKRFQWHHDVSRHAAKSSFDLQALLAEISEDAREVIALVLEPPIEITTSMAEKANVTTKRNALKSLLRDMGWSITRIGEVFQEIREALKD